MFRVVFCLLIVLSPMLSHAKQKICLNMIVKNESEVIQRCLDSVKPYIDYWVIVDTGSSDGTQKIIKKHMKGIPGKLYERPWKNWGETRTEALKLAQEKGTGDYILFMDADDILEFQGTDEKTKGFGPLTEDIYTMWRGSASFSYLKPQLAKRNLPLKWVGVTHEYLDCNIPHSIANLDTVKYVTLDGGATWKDLKAKFLKNVDLLEAGIKKEPDNARYAFYLAESYRDAGEKGKALEWYQRRIKMGGWAEELFCSYLQTGHMLNDLGLPASVVAEAYKMALFYRPHRAEPTYFLADLYLNQYRHQEAYDLIKEHEQIPQPLNKDSLFNLDWITDYGFKFQLSICAYYIGRFEEAIVLCDELLKNPALPANWRKQTEANKQFHLAKLLERKKNPDAATAKK